MFNGQDTIAAAVAAEVRRIEAHPTFYQSEGAAYKAVWDRRGSDALKLCNDYARDFELMEFLVGTPEVSRSKYALYIALQAAAHARRDRAAAAETAAVKRPSRTVRRESIATHRGRPLVLIIPPTCDVLLIREKGRRTAYELDILSAFSVAAKLAAAKRHAQRKEKI